MPDKDFVKAYLEDFSALVKPNDQIVEKIINAKNTLIQAKKKQCQNYDFWKWWQCSNCKSCQR